MGTGRKAGNWGSRPFLRNSPPSSMQYLCLSNFSFFHYPISGSQVSSFSILAVQRLWTHSGLLIWRSHIGEGRDSRLLSFLVEALVTRYKSVWWTLKDSCLLPHQHCPRWPLRTAATRRCLTVPTFPPRIQMLPSSHSQYPWTRGPEEIPLLEERDCASASHHL